MGARETHASPDFSSWRQTMLRGMQVAPAKDLTTVVPLKTPARAQQTAAPVTFLPTDHQPTSTAARVVT